MKLRELFTLRDCCWESMYLRICYPSSAEYMEEESDKIRKVAEAAHKYFLDSLLIMHPELKSQDLHTLLEREIKMGKVEYPHHPTPE